MSYLILVRHGESRWNLANKFCGWVDVPLSPTGIKEAQQCANKLQGLTLDVAFTSKLERAQETLLIVLAKQKYTGIFQHETGKMAKWSKHKHAFEKQEIPVYTSEKINERYYGKLQGLNKDAARRKWGKEQVFKWRRSYDIPPPDGECLKDVYNRVVPYFKKVILPHVRKKKDVIVAAHGNSLRAMIKYLDNISDEKIPHLELPFGRPIVYKHTKGKLIKEKHKHSFTRPVHWVKKK